MSHHAHSFANTRSNIIENGVDHRLTSRPNILKRPALLFSIVTNKLHVLHGELVIVTIVSLYFLSSNTISPPIVLVYVTIHSH